MQMSDCTLAVYCSSYSSAVYDANLARCGCRYMAFESRVNFLQLFRSCGLSLNPVNCSVWARGAVVRVGPAACRELWTPALWIDRGIWAHYLTILTPVKCPTLWSKYNSQHSAHKNLGIRQRRFFLFCGLVAVETDNKGQPSTWYNCVDPFSLGLTPVWIRMIRAE